MRKILMVLGILLIATSGYASNVIHRETLEYRTSVDTTEYPVSIWIINPVLPECPKKYWKIVGDEVLEMTGAEKVMVEACVFNKITWEYRVNVNGNAYSTDEWIINPVFPECLEKYWKIVGDEIKEMTAEEKVVVDVTIQAALEAAEEARKDIDTLEKLTKAFALVILDEINLLRVEAGLPERTIEQLRNAVKIKYDTSE